MKYTILAPNRKLNWVPGHDGIVNYQSQKYLETMKPIITKSNFGSFHKFFPRKNKSISILIQSYFHLKTEKSSTTRNLLKLKIYTFGIQFQYFIFFEKWKKKIKFFWLKRFYGSTVYAIVGSFCAQASNLEFSQVFTIKLCVYNIYTEILHLYYTVTARCIELFMT